MLKTSIDEFERFKKKRVTDETEWVHAIERFKVALSQETNASNLESAIVDKRSWHLPIECKFALLEKAKDAGCDSHQFWKDYYQYKATYMDPEDPQRPFYLKMANGKYL